MRSRFIRPLTAVVLALWALSPVLFTAASAAQAPTAEPTFTKEQMVQFLLKAKVTKSKQTTKGVTQPYRLTLTDGTVTHDAHFQSIDEHEMVRVFADGTRETNFVDSYQYNIAAYEIAVLVGLDDMMPVTVKRTWDAKTGSLSWWLPVKMDEETRLKQGVHPPDPEAWNGQMMKMRVFTALVDDTDRNLTNVLISDDWKLSMIDFSRAFRLLKTIRRPDDIPKCERQLFAKLQALDIKDVSRVTKGYVGKSEVGAMMLRRDKIVEHFKQRIATNGEAAVLY
jgi:hypothetical protein